MQQSTSLPNCLLLTLFSINLFLTAFTVEQATAQIVLTANDFHNQTGSTFEEWLAGENAGPLPQDLSMLESLLLSPGNNDTFDFSAITPQLSLFSTNRYLQLPSDSVDIPGYEAFFQGKATDVWHVEFVDESVPDVFLFRRISGDSLAWLGNSVWQDSNGDGTVDPVVSIFSPGKLQAPLPLQFNDAWSSDFTHFNIVNTPVGTVELPGVIEEHDIIVDGYGTLVTDSGSYPCLRVQINQFIQNPDGSTQELGGWSFITADLVQLGVFYDQLIPADPADITFDLQSPQSISLFIPASDGGMSTSIVDEPAVLPAGFSLSQNYPNPFNPTTSIPFELFEAGHVRLGIYNALGQHIETLVNQYLPAGEHHINWDARGLPSGPYFYRLALNGTSKQQTMTLFR